MATEKERRLATRLVWKIKVGLMALAIAMHWHLETRDAQQAQACAPGAASMACPRFGSQSVKVRSACVATCTGRLRAGQAAPANRAARAAQTLPAAPLAVSGS